MGQTGSSDRIVDVLRDEATATPVQFASKSISQRAVQTSNRCASGRAPAPRDRFAEIVGDIPSGEFH